VQLSPTGSQLASASASRSPSIQNEMPAASLESFRFNDSSSSSSSSLSSSSTSAATSDDDDDLDDIEELVLPDFALALAHDSINTEGPAPPSSPQSELASTPPDQEFSSTTISSTPLPTPELFFKAEDDTALKHEPSRHVDYLSHNWREEDIWSSWKHIVSKRRVYGERSRLENASWRTWAKQKHHLKTVPADTLNW
jgi:hypothetical protein